MAKFIFLCLLLPFSVFAQDTAKVSIPKLALVGGVTAGGFIYGHAIQSDLWWKGEKSDFHINTHSDYTYALNADKAGHFYFPYLATNIYEQAFRWTGMDSASSLYTAAALALSYQTYIEIRDGFSKEWGFSWGDAAANTLGAGFPVAQYHVPVLKNFTFKTSFFPSEKFKAGSNRFIFDDYESSYYWLSFKTHKILPAQVQEFYPAWLDFALGYSVKNLDYKGGGNGEIYLSLDWNLEELPGNSPFLRFLKHNLNFYHFPAPAVKIYPNVVWYGLKF